MCILFLVFQNLSDFHILLIRLFLLSFIDSSLDLIINESFPITEKSIQSTYSSNCMAFFTSPRRKRKIKWQDFTPCMFVYDKRKKPNFPEFPNYFFFSPYCNILYLDNRNALLEFAWPNHTGAIDLKKNK